MITEQVTVIMLTLNEAPNVGRSLDRLRWAKDVVVVDSGSTDGTLDILSQFPNVRVFGNPFSSHAEQWNFALTRTGIESAWVLALDADYLVPEGFAAELESLEAADEVAGYAARFIYRVHGKDLRGTVYPPVVVLYRREGARYIQDGHTQRIQLRGRALELAGHFVHDDRKPLSQWLAAQARYMQLEAAKIAAASPAELPLADRIRRLVVIAPPLMFLYCLFVRGNALDGVAGLFYALQRATAEAVLSLYILEARIGSRLHAP